MRNAQLTLIGLLTLVLFACGEAGTATQGPVITPAVDKPAAQPGEKLSYNRDIRPILSDKCFACHGPDKAAVAADLRLDTPEDGDDYDGAYLAIAPGDPNDSELVTRIRTDNPKLVMPPPSAKNGLTEEEKEKLVRWIEQGAEYEDHWSFVPLSERVEQPAVKNEAWVRDPIDRFVLARLEAEGIGPSKEATRERWLRRVSYDLTGLPPTDAELAAFLSDASGDAYEKVVDRLLASPHYGERMAVPWLDMARYADTYGFTVDGFRATWPWRDWVVQSFNDNLPYDRFLTWQIAGDLLPGATREQQLATAFSRLHRMNAEGGAIAEEWRNEGVADRLHTFGTAFMGMTFECARCHDHRYDPISQENYYQLFAFFNSIDESGTVEYKRPDIIPPPSMLLPTDAQQAELDRLKQVAADAESALGKLLAEREPAFKAWLEAGVKGAEIADVVGDFSFDALEGNKLINRIKGGGQGQVGMVESPANPTLEAGVNGQALRFDGDNYAFLPGMADIDRWTPFAVALWFKVDELNDGKPRVIAKRTSGTDVGPYGFDLMLEGGRVMARAYRHWPGNAVGVQTGEVVEEGKWVHVVWRYDGSSRADGLSLLIDGKLAETQVVRDGPLLKTVGGGKPFGAGAKELIIGQRFRDRGLSGGVVDEVKLVRRAVSDIEGKALYTGKPLDESLAGASDTQLRAYYLSAIDEPVRAARKDLEAKRKAFVQYETKIPEIAVMREMPQPRPAHILARGLYDAPRNDKNRVTRGVPESVMAWDDALPSDRLGLAKWLTKSGHPLTARVAVNRLWQQCFGTGIVASVDNFGLQGTLPTHPKLLDYLAVSYMQSGWDTKAMLRRIVLSATYRQDSTASPQQWKSDPDNALLARGPARRLDAEMIRDTALSASGLLVTKLGGSPAYPYQPAGLWKEVSSDSYRQGSGESLYRRSLYTVWKRAVPMPNMMAFDTPTREACTAERSATNTPLQALVLLNDVQYVEAARVLAQRVMIGAEGDEARIALGFRVLTGRAPTDNEAKALFGLLNEQRTFFGDDVEEAKALLAMGASKRDEKLDATEHAAMSVVMHAIFNLDATIWRR
ncbi:MAG: DUF1553 domain-containing protein [Phycisphaeraceae bacterium]|nr:DUF1553 domain-containing protein [Phycisphaeraceae bacterium]